MNIGFEKLKMFNKESETNKNEGTVIIEPLERGYGNTLGNALRRVLLSSMPGASVIGVEIENVKHEFDFIQGTTMDMTEFILNLKELRFKVESDDVEIVTFKQKKADIYNASVLDLPEGVTLMNGDAPFINLTGEEEVEIRLYVKNGRGYTEASHHPEMKEFPGAIEVDGVYSPIKKMGYQVENIRHIGDAAYERLILNVTTDGSVTAKDSVLLARKVLTGMLGFFDELSDYVEKTEIFQEKKEEEKRILDLSISDLELSVRSFNCLQNDGYTTVRKIVNLTERQLHDIHNLGKKSVEEIIEKVKELGLEMRR